MGPNILHTLLGLSGYLRRLKSFRVLEQGLRLQRQQRLIIIGALLLIAVLTNDTFRQLALSYSTKKKS